MCFSGESPKAPAPQKHTAGSRVVQTMPAKHTSNSSKPLYKLQGFTTQANVKKSVQPLWQQCILSLSLCFLCTVKYKLIRLLYGCHLIFIGPVIFNRVTWSRYFTGVNSDWSDEVKSVRMIPEVDCKLRS